ncbi:thioredoxin domain-containing protein [Anaplasma platys]|uniref:redoxin domain-containing protein n=1 Tax=Anaplasma platys TaxID=949 RepID=UPI00145EAAB2|nr:redoxin domain-containing protein [Anaplasma platys]
MAAVGTPSLDKGFVARDFRLKSVDGNFYDLKSLGDCSALLVMFICNHCPYVKAIIEHLVGETRELQESFNVGIVGGDCLTGAAGKGPAL